MHKLYQKANKAIQNTKKKKNQNQNPIIHINAAPWIWSFIHKSHQSETL